MLTGIRGCGGGGAVEVACGAGFGAPLVVVVVGVGRQRLQVVLLVARPARLDRRAVGVPRPARPVQPRLERRLVRALTSHAEHAAPRRQGSPLAFI